MQRSAPQAVRRVATLRATAAAALAAVLGAAPAAAQTGGTAPQCARAGRVLEDACQKSVDLFDLMAPQLGTAVAGGNAVMGQGGAFGRIGRFTLGLRATAVRGALPDVRDVPLSTSGAVRSDFPVNDQYLGAPAVDLAVGLFPGLPVGPGGLRVGAVDGLASAEYIPEYEGDDFAVRTPEGSLKLGYGARVGLLSETRFVPGVAVTYLRRDLPTVDVIGLTAARGAEQNDTLGVRDLRVETQAWRVVAGKRFLLLGLAAGVGQDRYSSGGRLGAVVNETVLGFPGVRFEAPEVALSQRLTRTNYFADVSLNLPGVKLAAEVGRTTGGRVRASYNSFDGGETAADDARFYAAAAIRFGY